MWCLDRDDSRSPWTIGCVKGGAGYRSGEEWTKSWRDTPFGSDPFLVYNFVGLLVPNPLKSVSPVYTCESGSSPSPLPGHKGLTPVKFPRLRLRVGPCLIGPAFHRLPSRRRGSVGVKRVLLWFRTTNLSRG